MLWLLKAITLITLTTIESRIHKLNFTYTKLLVLLIIFTPVFWMNIDIPKKTYAFLITSVLWIAFRLTTNKLVKTILFSITLLTLIFLVLNLSSLLDYKFNWDRERTVMVDNKYSQKLDTLRKQALYLPYSLRNIVYSNWIIPLNLLGRTINWIWFDRLLNTIGFTLIFPMVLSIISSKNYAALFIIFTGVFTGIINRLPETTSMYLPIMPAIITLFVNGSKNLKPKILILMTIVSVIYQFTA